MRNPVELAVQQVLPVPVKPGVTAGDAASVSRPFALLLAEAEAVHDVVRLSAVVPAGALSLRSAWDFFCARLPWSGAPAPLMASPALRTGRQRRR